MSLLISDCEGCVFTCGKNENGELGIGETRTFKDQWMKVDYHFDSPTFVHGGVNTTFIGNKKGEG